MICKGVAFLPPNVSRPLDDQGRLTAGEYSYGPFPIMCGGEATTATMEVCFLGMLSREHEYHPSEDEPFLALRQDSSAVPEWSERWLRRLQDKGESDLYVVSFKMIIWTQGKPHLDPMTELSRNVKPTILATDGQQYLTMRRGWPVPDSGSFDWSIKGVIMRVVELEELLLGEQKQQPGQASDDERWDAI